MKIRFCGAAEGVTGSCHHVTTEKSSFLLDCGMFQGNKANVARNKEAFPFDVKDIEFVILSHAHVDHCGRLPLLVKRGYDGPIYCTDATADLLEIMLLDSAYIQEKDTEYINKKNARLGKPLVEPLYTAADAEAALRLVEPVLYDVQKALNEEVTVKFTEAGHILGSAAIELWVDGTKLVFSGDLGVRNRPILRDPDVIKDADIVMMESTYGNRIHPPAAAGINELAAAIKKTVRRGGTAVIPCFAVGRTQEILYDINQLLLKDKDFAAVMKNVKVYVDSPMAGKATEVFKKNAQVFDTEAREILLSGDNPISFENLHFVKDVKESQLLNVDKSPKVILSSSGMCDAGRIKHHLKHNLWDARNSVIFVGYQAEGTLGRIITDGAEEVRIFGETIKVAAEIIDLKGFSGHADQNDLISWLGNFDPAPERVFLVHGEEQAKLDLAAVIEETMGIKAVPVLKSGIVDLSEVVDDAAIRLTPREKEALKLEALLEMRGKLAEIHRSIEHILYTTELAADESLTDEKLQLLNEHLMELEKHTLNLGSTVTDMQN